MIILFDTNIVLDILLDREPFSIESKEILLQSIERGHRIYISSSSIADIYYIANKKLRDRKLTLELIRNLSIIFKFAPVDENCILSAFDSKIKDFEDAMIDAIGTNIHAEYIVTRNYKDFAFSNNNILLPSELLEKYNE